MCNDLEMVGCGYSIAHLDNFYYPELYGGENPVFILAFSDQQSYRDFLLSFDRFFCWAHCCSPAKRIGT